MYSWKDHGGILLNCFLREEADKVLEEFHVGDRYHPKIFKTSLCHVCFWSWFKLGLEVNLGFG